MDAHNNSAAATTSVIVRDTTAPALTAPAATVLEATGPTGASTTVNAHASDIADPAVTVGCAPNGSFPLGTTTVTCTARDASGNTTTVSTTVTVGDTTPPTVTATAPIPLQATGPNGATTTVTATAADIVDGTVAANCSPNGTFAVGTTTVLCTATDAHGNRGSATTSVNVIDTTPPALSVPPAITLEATGPNGASRTIAGTATDLVDGSVPVTCAPNGTFPLGTTAVACTATDAHHNVATAPTSVTVVDTKPPVLTLPASFTANATSLVGAVVAYTATAKDLVDGSDGVNCLPASGSMFAIGTTNVTCTARDAHANSASGSFTVSVLGAREQIAALVAKLAGIHGGFTQKLEDVLKELEKTDKDNDKKDAKDMKKACDKLRDFVHHVQTESGKHISVTLANETLAAAAQIAVLLGC